MLRQKQLQQSSDVILKIETLKAPGFFSCLLVVHVTRTRSWLMEKPGYQVEL